MLCNVANKTKQTQPLKKSEKQTNNNKKTQPSSVSPQLQWVLGNVPFVCPEQEEHHYWGASSSTPVEWLCITSI